MDHNDNKRSHLLTPDTHALCYSTWISSPLSHRTHACCFSTAPSLSRLRHRPTHPRSATRGLQLSSPSSPRTQERRCQRGSRSDRSTPSPRSLSRSRCPRKQPGTGALGRRLAGGTATCEWERRASGTRRAHGAAAEPPAALGGGCRRARRTSAPRSSFGGRGGRDALALAFRTSLTVR